MGGELIPNGWASRTILHSHAERHEQHESRVGHRTRRRRRHVVRRRRASRQLAFLAIGVGWTHPDGRTVGPDCPVERTVFYKVGHHGSHNATLRQQGLEQMKRLKTAVIPVDEIVAKKMRWGAMPLESLVAALSKQTERNNGQTLRTDIPPKRTINGVAATDLYYEMAV